jgi:hypothetical protein
LLRKESAGSLPAESRFLADRPGFGMTRGELFLEQTAALPTAINP